MNRLFSRTGALALTSALCLLSVGRLTAQTTAPAAGTANQLPEDETIVLSPFVVESSQDSGYVARDTLAGTRVRTELKDVGSAISVVTSQFLKDTGSRNSQDLLVYTTNTEVGGTSGNFAGLGNGQQLDDTSARLSPHTNTRVRGLAAADNTRDFFLTDIPWDSFNVGRVDLQRGPNSILYGLGSPAGIINSSTNGAAFRNENIAEFRFGSYGSVRGTLDLNRELLDDELALRISGLDDETKYRQDPAYNHDKRLYAAARWDPKFLRGASNRTTFKVNYENGDINANRPRTLPPGDLITPWWNSSINKLLIDPRQVGISDPAAVAAGGPGTGVRQATLTGGAPNPYYNPRIGSFGRNYGGIVAVFSDPNSGAFNLRTTDLNVARGLNAAGEIDGNIGGIPWSIMSGIVPFKDFTGTAGSAAYPGQEYGIYKNYVLQDASVFDFYNKLIDGPNKYEWSNHEAFNASLAQTFLDNRLGFEAVFDKQDYDRGQVNMTSDFGQSITIDMNRFYPDGTPNPNVGRAAMVSDGFANNSYRTAREGARLTGFGEFKFSDVMDGQSWLTRALGRHVFTGLLSSEKVETERRSWFRSAADASYGDEINDKLLRNRGVNILTYLGPSLLDRTSAAGAYLPNLTALQIPTSGTLRHFSSRYVGSANPGAVWIDPSGNASTQSENPANYTGWTNRNLTVISDDAGQRDQLTSNADLALDKVESKAFIWQAYLFDGVLVPTFGLRTDKARSYALGSGPKRADETIDLSSPLYVLPEEPDNIVSGRSKSWSVVLHSPNFIKRRLPFGSAISLFYNKSDNFQPAAGRVDTLGNTLAPPSGETKDYGVVLSALDNKVSLKINWYKTTVTNDRLTNFSGDYMLPAAEAWGYMFARQNIERYGNFQNGYDLAPGQTDVAQAMSDGDAASRAFIAGGPSDAWYALWGIDRSQWNSWMNWTTPPGVTITGDTMSKGIEFELAAQPVKGWDISLNASKTRAQRTNMAESFAVWVEDRWAFYNTPVAGTGGRVLVGDVRMWNGSYSPGETVRGKFGREFMAPYRLYRLQEGSDVPELRPWRFNLVTNYRFDSGLLRDVNFGVGYRWQDRVVTGYKLIPTNDPTDPYTFDLENPYRGPTEQNIDAWVGYERKISSKIKWRIQLNARNITSKKELIPITVQPDGSMAVGRIADPFIWSVTNTFTF